MGAAGIGILQARGAQSITPSRYKPVWTDRFFQGYYTNRNPMRSPLSAYYAEGWGLGKTDALIAGQNIELSIRLTPARRPGFLQWSTASLPSNVTAFYGFRTYTSASSSIDLIVDTATGPYKLTPTAATSIFTKSTGAGVTRCLGLANTLYLADGVDSLAWMDGGIAPNPRNWGISIGPFSAMLGPNDATSGTNVTVTGHAWANPSYVADGIPGTTATVTLGAGASLSDLLCATGYGFSAIPTSSITHGVVASFYGFQSSTTGSVAVQLMKNGVPVGNVKTVTLPSSRGVVTLGSSSDLWGTTLLPSDLMASGFGVSISAVCQGSGTTTFHIDDIYISVYATLGPNVSILSGSGSMSATSGYKYVVAYGNGNGAVVSGSTPASASTGSFSNKAGIQVSISASPDPQVNQIWVFRTTDGGASYYALPTSPYPNTTQNITDTATDSQLNILLPAPINGSGTPPPAGATIPVYHMGRVWVMVGNVLYASEGPDAIWWNGAESFPPANCWTLPAPGVRMLPTASGLVLFLSDRVQIVPNPTTNTIPNFSPIPLVDGIGLLNYDAMDVYGSAAYLYTADKQFISFDLSNGVTELGFPIEDQLTNLSPTAVSVAYHTTGLDRGVFVCNGSGTWYRCVPQQPPDFSITGPVWSPPGIIASGTISLMKSIETSDGVRQLLAANGESVMYRDSSFSTFTDLGTAYDASGVIGNIVLANPGQLAELGFITADFVRIGTSPLISVLMDEISGSYSLLPNAISDPPRLYGISGAPATLYSNRYYFRQSTASGGTPPPAYCRHMQIKIDFGSDTVQNEILSNTIWGTILEEGSA